MGQLHFNKMLYNDGDDDDNDLFSIHNFNADGYMNEL